jgi:hypothetical protein
MPDKYKLKYLIEYARHNKEGFVVSVRGNVVLNIYRFLKMYESWIDNDFNIIFIDDDLNKIPLFHNLHKETDITRVNFFITKNLHMAYLHKDFSGNDTILVFQNEKINNLTIASNENSIRVISAHVNLKVIFFTKPLDMTSNNPLYDGIYAWNPDMNDFLKANDPIYLNNQITDYTTGIDPVIKMMQEIRDGIEEIKETFDSLNDETQIDKILDEKKEDA